GRDHRVKLFERDPDLPLEMFLACLASTRYITRLALRADPIGVVLLPRLHTSDLSLLVLAVPAFASGEIATLAIGAKSVTPQLLGVILRSRFQFSALRAAFHCSIIARS